MTPGPIRLRLGTRSSALALAQSRLVAAALEEIHAGVSVELVPLQTRGDALRGPLAAIGGKGLFTAELEAGLADGSLDLAVHSLKDLPVRLASGLAIAAHPPRDDPRDVLLSTVASSIEELPTGARVLTGSLRRRAQLLRRRPDLGVEDLRGNVDTRLRKWRESGAEGLILAAAGLRRLGIESGEIGGHPLAGDVMVPAPGQGILAVECRLASRAFEICRALEDLRTARAAQAERSVVAAFGGDCTLPLGAWARYPDGAAGEASGEESLTLSVFVASRDARRWLETTVRAADPEAAARAAVERLRRDGVAAILGESGA